MYNNNIIIFLTAIVLHNATGSSNPKCKEAYSDEIWKCGMAQVKSKARQHELLGVTIIYTDCMHSFYTFETKLCFQDTAADDGVQIILFWYYNNIMKKMK